MACPYFYPVARFESSGWVVPPRLPLGDPYTGECRAAGIAFQPDETRIRHICNLGYGRGRCDCFPDRASTDAVRFHVARDAGELIHIQYIFEKECWPQAHGVFDCDGATGNLSNGPDDQILRKQASAFIQSYLRRKS
jgi:hypothetical protein